MDHNVMNKIQNKQFHRGTLEEKNLTLNLNKTKKAKTLSHPG